MDRCDLECIYGPVRDIRDRRLITVANQISVADVSYPWLKSRNHYSKIFNKRDQARLRDDYESFGYGYLMAPVPDICDRSMAYSAT